MSKSEIRKLDGPTEASETPVEASVEAPVEENIETKARERAACCWRELQIVLDRHRCRIVPYLMPLEPVGTSGGRAMVTASFAVIPER